MKKLFLFPALLCAVLCCAEIQIKVINSNAEMLAAFPVVAEIAETPGEADADSLEIKDASGKKLSCQWDDLNTSGKVDAGDEIAFSADLQPGENVFVCRFFKGGAKKSGTSTANVIENEWVKVVQNKQKLLLRNIFLKEGNKAQLLAGAFVLEPRMDNSWKWDNSKLITEIISSGPVRKILRVAMEKKSRENGKTVRIINDLSIFTGRKEILSKLSFVNTSSGQLVQINTVNTGMYQVMSDGKSVVSGLDFAGTCRKGSAETVAKGKVESGSFLLRRPVPGQAVWCDVSSGKSGFGMAPESAENVDNLLIRTISGNKSIRMSILFAFEKAVLWPGKSVSCAWWMIPHRGGYAAVEKFAETMNRVKVVK